MTRMLIKFPDLKLSQQQKRIHDEAVIWYDNGFSWETSVVAATMILKINTLDRRVRHLEGRKNKNFSRHKSRRMRGNVVLLHNYQPIGD